MMKAIMYTCIFILILISCNESTKNIKMHQLISKTESLDGILDHYLENMGWFYNWKENVIVLRTERMNNGDLQARLAALHRQDFSWYLRGKQIPVYGYFEYDGKTVLVFGKASEIFFEKTDQYKELVYLQVTEVEKPVVQDGEIPPPPRVFEPHVWVYEYKDGEFKFLEDGLYYLLE